MNLRRVASRGGELLLDVFALAITAQAGNVIIGRAINSPTAFRLSSIPLVGPLADSFRGFWDQGYDPTTETRR